MAILLWAWSVQNFGREVIVCVQLRFSIYYNYAEMKGKAGVWYLNLLLAGTVLLLVQQN